MRTRALASSQPGPRPTRSLLDRPASARRSLPDAVGVPRGPVVTRHPMRTAHKLAGALLALGLALSPVARASIVERVVAVVGEKPILLTELQHRARPFLARIYGSTPNAAQR